VSNSISVPPDVKNFLLCRCGRFSDCGLRKTPPKLDEEDIQNIWLPAGFLNRIEGSTFLESIEDTPRKEAADYSSRENAVREYIKEMNKKVKSLKQDTYPSPESGDA
jgi:hypothetical protein